MKVTKLMRLVGLAETDRKTTEHINQAKTTVTQALCDTKLYIQNIPLLQQILSGFSY